MPDLLRFSLVRLYALFYFKKKENSNHLVDFKAQQCIADFGKHTVLCTQLTGNKRCMRGILKAEKFTAYESQ